MKIVLIIVSYILFGILFDLWHKYAYKRCVKNKRCREWMCKYFHECEYANERDQD